MEIYERIYALCVAKGVNITIMCREAGVARSSLTDLKHGRSNSLHITAVKRIADYFGVSTDVILFGVKDAVITYEENRAEDMVRVIVESEYLYDMFLLLEKMTEEQRSLTKRLAEAVLDAKEK